MSEEKKTETKTEPEKKTVDQNTPEPPKGGPVPLEPEKGPKKDAPKDEPKKDDVPPTLEKLNPKKKDDKESDKLGLEAIWENLMERSKAKSLGSPEAKKFEAWMDRKIDSAKDKIGEKLDVLKDNLSEIKDKIKEKIQGPTEGPLTKQDTDKAIERFNRKEMSNKEEGPLTKEQSEKENPLKNGKPPVGSVTSIEKITKNMQSGEGLPGDKKEDKKDDVQNEVKDQVKPN